MEQLTIAFYILNKLPFSEYFNPRNLKQFKLTIDESGHATLRKFENYIAQT